MLIDSKGSGGRYLRKNRKEQEREERLRQECQAQKLTHHPVGNGLGSEMVRIVPWIILAAVGNKFERNYTVR